MSASARRIWGLIYRHLALYRRSWPRLLDLAYGPVLQMTIWGFTARYVLNGSGGALAGTAATFLGGVLLWEVALHSQMGFSMSFLEEVWSRNLGHVFVSPLRPWEMLAAFLVLSALRVAVGVVPAIALAWLLYAYNLFLLGPALLALFVNLLVMGWWVALGVVAMVLRHGAGAGALSWTVLFGLTPFAAVFYPVAVLPATLRPVARALPAAHVFEGMRAVLGGATMPWAELAWASGLNLAWMAAAVALFVFEFRTARIRGALLVIGE